MLSDVELALLVLGVIASLVFFGLLAVILNTQCTQRYVEQRDTYIMATFVFLSACFLSRSINLIFVGLVRLLLGADLQAGVLRVPAAVARGRVRGGDLAEAHAHWGGVLSTAHRRRGLLLR